jgi:hypothetical protein
MEILIMMLLFVMLATMAFADEKIYTNKDLQKYQDQKGSPALSNPDGRLLKPMISASDFDLSFDELHGYIKHKLKDIGVREYQRYLRPLRRGMTREQVDQLWGTKTLGGMHEGNDSKTWAIDVMNYEIGVSLYFENSRLRGWKIFNTPSSKVTDQTRENEKVLISISGCPTLQDGTDGKTGRHGHATFWIWRHGQTIKEICNTVGQGCESCKLLQKK